MSNDVITNDVRVCEPLSFLIRSAQISSSDAQHRELSRKFIREQIEKFSQYMLTLPQEGEIGRAHV